jgi:pilus assembly protein CpaB
VQVPVVTLLVAPEDSEKLALAASHGDLQLTMRSGVDTQQMVTAGVSPKELFAIEVPAEAEKPDANIVVTEKAERASRPRRRREPAPLSPSTTIVTAREPEKREEIIEIIRGPKTEQRKIRLPETPPQGGR